MLAHAGDHLAVDEGRVRCLQEVQFHARRARHDLQFEGMVDVEERTRIVIGPRRVEDRERAAPQERVQATLPPVKELRDLLLRQVLQAAARPDDGVDETRRIDEGGAQGRLVVVRVQGRISIGVSGRVSSQTSSMSSFDRAMQPLVQSLLW